MRSATAPANGCVRPHHSWPKANARLMLPRPEPGGGVQRRQEQAHRLARAHRQRERAGRGQQHQPQRASAWAPAARASFIGLSFGVGPRSRSGIRRAARAARATRSTPSRCVERFLRRASSGAAPRRACRGRPAVACTRRLRPSAPAPSSSQPAATSGCRLRVSVDASIFIARARSPGADRPQLQHVRQQRVLRGLQPGLADFGVVVLRHAPHQLAQLEVGAALRLDGGRPWR